MCSFSPSRLPRRGNRPDPAPSRSGTDLPPSRCRLPVLPTPPWAAAPAASPAQEAAITFVSSSWVFPPYSHRSIAPQVTWTQKSRQFRPEPAHFVPTEPLTKAELPRVNLKTENVTDSEEFSCWASHFSAGILCVLQGKMVQRSAKRPAVRACWQFSDALYKQNAPISGSEISGKAPAGQTCPCRAQPGNRSPLHIHSQQKLR